MCNRRFICHLQTQELITLTDCIHSASCFLAIDNNKYDTSKISIDNKDRVTAEQKSLQSKLTSHVILCLLFSRILNKNISNVV